MTNETLQAIIEFSTDGIYVVNKKGITIYVNEAYEKITGTNKQNVLGKHMQTVIDEGYIDQSVSLLVLEEKKTALYYANDFKRKRRYGNRKSSV